MQRVQQAPIKLYYELKGFVANSLQEAILVEAFRLVEDGEKTRVKKFVEYKKNFSPDDLNELNYHL